MALTKITQGVIKSNENYDTNNINSTGIITATGVTVTGDLNVAGVLTYDDVTNIDSVGIITAQSGIHVTGGSVGIGTDNPIAPLHVEKDGTSQVLARFESNMGTNNNRAISLSSPTSDSGSEPFIFNTGNAYQFQTDDQVGLHINYNRNIGIGTDNPAGKLHLSSGESGDCVLILESDTDNNQESDNSYIEFRQDGGLAHSKVGLEDNELVIANSAVLREGIVFRVGDSSTPGWQQATEKLRITSSGGVGIGTDNPIGTNALTDNTSILAVGIATVGALHVNGNAYPSAGALSNRNLVINGGFDVWQRGTSVSTRTSSGYFGADRWRSHASGGTYNESRETVPLGDSTVGRFKYFMRHTCTIGNDYNSIQHRIEGVGTVPEGKATLSFYAKGTNPAGGSLSAGYAQNFGTGGSPSSTNQPAEVNFTLTSSWQRFTIEFTVDSISGKTLGTDNNDYFQIFIGQPGGDTSTDAWTLDITGVQLETGSVATPFEHRSYNDELTRCQRYYTRYDHSSGGMGLNAPGFYNTASIIFSKIFFPTPMRTEGMALTYSDLTHFDLEPWDYPMSSVTLYRVAPNCVTLTGNPATTRSTGDVAFLTIDQTNAWIAFESEL